jgi:hypothetical protein
MTKGNRILRYGCRTFDAFWVPDDIESCNFQNLLVLGFPETSQNLMSFIQLLFSLFHGGTKGKNLKTPKSVKCPASISENPVPLLKANYVVLNSFKNEHFLFFSKAGSKMQGVDWKNDLF